MTNEYRVEFAATDGVAYLQHPRYHRQVWVRCRLQKDCCCAATGRRLRAGATVYKPVTNQRNRTARIAVAFVEKALRRARKGVAAACTIS
jgi:hypothetical protein